MNNIGFSTEQVFRDWEITRKMIIGTDEEKSSIRLLKAVYEIMRIAKEKGSITYEEINSIEVD
jgi:hypothetical protein